MPRPAGPSPNPVHRTDRWVDRWVRFGPGDRWAGFVACGAAGLVVATGWTAVLATTTGRPGWLGPVLATVMVAALLAVAGVEAVVVGRPRLVCFHDELVALGAAAAALAALGQPVLAGLDLVVPGLALFLVGGRLGCLVAGCCHGRPAGRGVRYGPRHFAEGLPAEYVGIPLFPVPAVEAGGLLLFAALASAAVLAPVPAGAVLAGYLLLHLGLRFWLEFLRGDEGRPTWAGLSEAQWTAVVGTASIAAASIVGAWPALIAPSLVATALVGGGAVAVTVRPEWHRLRAAGHVREIAAVVRGADAAGGLVVSTTSQGVRVSAGPAGRHVAFSRAAPALGPTEAALLGRLAASVRGTGVADAGSGGAGRDAGGRARLYRSGNGVYHLVTSGSER